MNQKSRLYRLINISILVLTLSTPSLATLTLLDAKAGPGINNTATISGGTLTLLEISTSLLSLSEANNQGLSITSLLSEGGSGETIALEISQVLPYPNPLRISEGGHLYYTLNQNISLNCLVFDMFGRKILTKTFASGAEGGRVGVNRVPVNGAFFNNYPVSSGVYFILIMNNGTVLKKAKIALIP